MTHGQTEEPRFDGVIFDLDGTLVDTLEDLADAMNRVLAGEGLPGHSYASYRGMIGSGLRRLVGDALPPAVRTEAAIARCFDLMTADYGRHCLVKTRPYDGVATMLDELRAGGVLLAVFSNKLDELTRLIVGALFERGTFEVVAGARPDVPLKPDPSGAVLIGTRLGLAPGRIAYLGDSATDMLTATRAGMIALGAGWGFRSARELRESGATLVLRHPSDLPALRAAPRL